MGAHLRVNIHAMSYLTKAAVPHMEDGSAIINTASMSINADKPNPTLLAYATTKGAIQLHGGTGAAACRKRHSRECRRAGAFDVAVYSLLPTESAMAAPRAPSGLSPRTVESRTV